MLIELKGVSKSYHSESGNEVKALSNVNFSLAERESISIVGPSGAGKSTLLHLMGLMDSQDSGSIYFDGEVLAPQDEVKRSLIRREKIGFVFQMHYLLAEFNILENMLLPAWKNRKTLKVSALALLEELGLSHRASHLPGELSGGEQQRAALARALINNPMVLLCDEPTGNLDRKNAEAVERIVIDECKKRGVSLVIVTHNPELAKKTAKIIEMHDGTIS